MILLMLPVVAGVGRMLRSRRQGKRIHPFSLGVVLFFSTVAILEIVGVVSMVSVLSSWLVFTGA